MKTAIITFDTTTDAMAMEEFAKRENVSGSLIPIPNAISAGCGLAWDYEDDDSETLKIKLDGSNISYSDIHLLEV